MWNRQRFIKDPTTGKRQARMNPQAEWVIQDVQKKGGPPRQPKNLQVLKNIEPAQIGPLMRTYAAALGVRCEHCHIQGDFASDDNPKKAIARMMIGMTQDINAKFPDGKAHVACYTCHRGSTEPAMAPPPAEAPKQ